MCDDRRAPRLRWPLAALGMLIAACTVTTGDGTLEDDGRSVDVSDDDGAGGSAGVGGADGSPGQEVPHVCRDGEPSSADVSFCDDLAVAPPGPADTAPLCVDDDGFSFEPYAYTVCQLGFQHYQPGHAERLAACLATIGAADACIFEPVQACLDSTYDAACNNPSADALCLDVFEACANDGEPFDYNLCSFELRLFNEASLLAFADCYAMNEAICQPAYDTCFAALE